jgi:hypothetical protein
MNYRLLDKPAGFAKIQAYFPSQSILDPQFMSILAIALAVLLALYFLIKILGRRSAIRLMVENYGLIPEKLAPLSDREIKELLAKLHHMAEKGQSVALETATRPYR